MHTVVVLLAPQEEGRPSVTCSLILTQPSQHAGFMCKPCFFCTTGVINSWLMDMQLINVSQHSKRQPTHLEHEHPYARHTRSLHARVSVAWFMCTPLWCVSVVVLSTGPAD